MKERIKNKNLGLYSITIFLFTFLIGASFALSSGLIDIYGTINISSPVNYVVWERVEHQFEVNATQNTEIINFRGRTNQRIIWDVYFEKGPYVYYNIVSAVAITATARNESPLNYMKITNVSVVSAIQEGALYFGVKYDILLDLISTSPIPPLSFGEAIIKITWDGTINSENNEDLNFGLLIEFYYEVYK